MLPQLFVEQVGHTMSECCSVLLRLEEFIFNASEGATFIPCHQLRFTFGLARLQALNVLPSGEKGQRFDTGTTITSKVHSECHSSSEAENSTDRLAELQAGILRLLQHYIHLQGVLGWAASL